MTTDDTDHARSNAAAWAWDLIELCARHQKATNAGRDDEDAEAPEDIEQEARESALSVEVRTGWRSPGHTDAEPEEFCITLSTGGPALAIFGELGAHGEPIGARLEFQNWGTRWTYYTDARELDGVSLPEALDWFAGLFWFGG